MDRLTAIKKISDRFSLSEKDIIELLEGAPVLKKEKISDSLLSNKPAAKKISKPILTQTQEKTHHAHIHQKKYYFLEDDYLLFLNKMSEVLEEIDRLGDEVGESCAESESWHDNFCYEEGGRQQALWKDHLKELQKIKENVFVIGGEKANISVIKAKGANEQITIGSTVELETENGEIIIKKIGSYITFSGHDISYESPLAKALIGKKSGNEAHGIINKQNVCFKIKKIT